jgi:hypothetical protein
VAPRAAAGDPRAGLDAGVLDERDRVLQLHLPDGAYRVTLDLPALRDRRMRVEVYAEGKRVLHRTVGAEDGPSRATLRVEARDGLATLVFHAPPGLFERGRADFWALRGLHVEDATRGGDGG